MTTVKHHAGEQAVTSDVEEHEREHAIAHTLRLVKTCVAVFCGTDQAKILQNRVTLIALNCAQIQQNQHDCNLNNLLDEFHR